jgi:hypothetical protein
MYVKSMSVTKTKRLIAMETISKSEVYVNVGPLIKHGPHWINFITFIFTSEKNRYSKCLYKKFGTKLFHLT